MFPFRREPEGVGYFGGVVCEKKKVFFFRKSQRLQIPLIFNIVDIFSNYCFPEYIGGPRPLGGGGGVHHNLEFNCLS